MSEEPEPFEIPVDAQGNLMIDPDLFFAKNEKGKTLWTKFLSLYLAMVLEETDGPFFALIPDGDIYRYEHPKGYWVRDGIKIIQESAQKYLQSFTTTHRVNETISTIRRRNYIEQDLVNSNPIGLERIVVANGVLNLKTQTLGLFDPELYALNAFDIHFDPDAECPTILKFLTEITSDLQDLATLQEWFGYHLWRTYFIHKALMVIGEGSNGKTTLLKLLKKFIGNVNCSYVGLYELVSDRFAAADLFGKLANIADDISPDELKRTGRFKMLTGESTLRSQFKNQTAFNFDNIAKATFSANKLPDTSDLTYAFFRRWIILKFNQIFEGDNCDRQLLQKMTTPEELSGLLTWALKGLKRLLSNHDFSLSTSAKETQADWKIQSNPIAFFIHVHIKKNLSSVVKKWDVYNAYSPFCAEHGFKPLAYSPFCQRLKETITGLKDSRPRIDGKQVPCWNEIELKDPNEETPLSDPNGASSHADQMASDQQKTISDFERGERPPTTPDSSDFENNNMEGRRGKVARVAHDGPLDRVAQNLEQEDQTPEQGEESKDTEDEDSFGQPDDYPTELSTPRPDTAEFLSKGRPETDTENNDEEE